MKALIIIPAYSHIDHRLSMALHEARVPHMPLHGSSDLPRARSILISIALRQGPERILFIDADIVPTPAQIVELAETELVTPQQALTGLYPIRDTRATVNGGATWAVDAVDRDLAASGAPTFEANWAGLGFCAIHAESLHRVAETLPVITDETAWRPFCVPWVDNAERRYYPDDRVLFWRLARTGNRLLASSSLKVGHVASVVLTEAR